MNRDFEIVGKITDVETIATGSSIRELPELRARFGQGRWRKGVANVRLSDGTIRLAEVHWYEAHCINNDGYVDDLKVRTVYRILPDESAARSNYLRVVDETGEDYLYPASKFVVVDVPAEAAEALLLAAA